jgi:hypothetical protein
MFDFDVVWRVLESTVAILDVILRWLGGMW